MKLAYDTYFAYKFVINGIWYTDACPTLGYISIDKLYDLEVIIRLHPIRTYVIYIKIKR